MGPGMYLGHNKSINVSPDFFQNQFAVVRDSDRTRKVQIHEAPGLIISHIRGKVVLIMSEKQ